MGSSVSTPAAAPSASLPLRAAFLAAAAFSLTPWASPGIALALGAALVLAFGNPFPKQTARASQLLLQAAVVGLGFGIQLDAVLRLGALGFAGTAGVVALALGGGILLGRWLRLGSETTLLLSSGTGICGGTAIAAVGSAIGAQAEAMSLSLASVFLLNVVALYLFPVIGHALDLSQLQFGAWAAVAIHDTSSVVGAAAAYGEEALQSATVLKLARTLWLIPLTLVAAAWAGRRAAADGGAADQAPARGKVKLPWFVVLFVLAALVRSLVPESMVPTLSGISRLARVVLVLVLFLIGARLSRATLRSVGVRPFVHALVLWVVVGGLALLAVMRWVPG